MHFMAAEVWGLKRLCELIRQHPQAGGVHDLGLDRELRDALPPDRLLRHARPGAPSRSASSRLWSKRIAVAIPERSLISALETTS